MQVYQYNINFLLRKIHVQKRNKGNIYKSFFFVAWLFGNSMAFRKKKLLMKSAERWILSETDCWDLCIFSARRHIANVTVIERLWKCICSICRKSGSTSTISWYYLQKLFALFLYSYGRPSIFWNKLKFSNIFLFLFGSSALRDGGGWDGLAW